MRPARLEVPTRSDCGFAWTASAVDHTCHLEAGHDAEGGHRCHCGRGCPAEVLPTMLAGTVEQIERGRRILAAPPRQGAVAVWLVVATFGAEEDVVSVHATEAGAEARAAELREAMDKAQAELDGYNTYGNHDASAPAWPAGVPCRADEIRAAGPWEVVP